MAAAPARRTRGKAIDVHAVAGGFAGSGFPLKMDRDRSRRFFGVVVRLISVRLLVQVPA